MIIKPWLYLRYKSCRTTLSNAMDYSKKFQQCTIYVLFISKPACTVAYSKGLLFIIMYNHQNWLLFDCKRIIAKQLTAIYIRNDTKFPLFCQLICNRHNTHLPIIETDEEKAIIDSIAANTESQ